MLKSGQWAEMKRYKNNGISIWPVLTGGVLVCCLAGCAASDAGFSIYGEAASVINRDHGGRPLSVAVKVYQLRSDQLFSRLTYESLTAGKGEQALLGNELIGMKELMVIPGGVVRVDGLKAVEETRFLALVGFFRQPDKTRWRLLFPVANVKGSKVMFKVEDCYLLAVQPAVQALPDQIKGMSPSCER